MSKPFIARREDYYIERLRCFCGAAIDWPAPYFPVVGVCLSSNESLVRIFANGDMLPMDASKGHGWDWNEGVKVDVKPPRIRHSIA